MSVLNENISIKIRDIQHLSWDISSVSVAARPYHALVFRLDGSAVFVHDGLKFSTATEDVFYMPADCQYDAFYQGKNDLFAIDFDSDLVAQPENFILKNPHLISVYFSKLYKIWSEKQEGYYLKSISLMCELLQEILSQQEQEFGSDTIEAFENAVSYMEENFTSSDFTINDMVEKAYMSNTYFRRIFVAKFGMTPIKYLKSKRLMYAEKILSTGKYSIKDVAEMSGFGDVKYFSRVVKKEYGVSPSRLYYRIKK